MPIAASSRAHAPKIVKSSMLKFCRAIDSPTTCSIERTRAAASCASTARISRSTAGVSTSGFAVVRTAQTSGSTAKPKCVSASDTCASGT